MAVTWLHRPWLRKIVGFAVFATGLAFFINIISPQPGMVHQHWLHMICACVEMFMGLWIFTWLPTPATPTQQGEDGLPTPLRDRRGPGNGMEG